MKRATYGCFLSDLTGFMGFHCTGPGDCHKSVLQSHVLYYTASEEKCNIFVGEPVSWCITGQEQPVGIETYIQKTEKRNLKFLTGPSVEY